jgi:hypothetical protein
MGVGLSGFRLTLCIGENMRLGSSRGLVSMCGVAREASDMLEVGLPGHSQALVFGSDRLGSVTKANLQIPGSMGLEPLHGLLEKCTKASGRLA